MERSLILVTGATGFIGRRLLTFLESIEAKVRIISRKPQLGYDNIICDFEQDKIPSSALKSVSTVFHLSGFAHDLRNTSNTKHLYQKINVDATLELAELARDNGVQRFVFVSSVKAGGSAVVGKCMTENDYDEPEGVYGKTKREAEIKLLKLGNNADMQISIVRPSLVYGPDVKGNLRLMLSGIEKGWFPPLPETGNQRSMIHVDDLVRALILVSEDDRASGEIFIATEGKPYSSREIYEAMCGAVGRPIPKWSVPKLLFYAAAAISPNIKHKIDKLLGEEYYSSEKLEGLGFRTQRTLIEMNETSF